MDHVTGEMLVGKASTDMLDQIVIVQGQGLQEIVVSRGHDGIQLIVNIIYIMQFPDRAN
ncbi:hypothetical protein D3C80_1907560 [compost metagenome]